MSDDITIDARMLEHSGIGTYLRHLLDSFAVMESEYAFRVIGRAEEPFAGLPRGKFHWVAARSPIYSLSEQWEIARLARSSLLLHSPHYNAPLLYRGKLVATIHDLIHLTDPTFQKTAAARFYARPMFHLVARRADRIIADSEFTKQQIVEHLGVSPGKVVVVYLGVSDHFRPLDPEQASRRASSLLGLDRPYLLFVGNLKPHKNVATLLRAFSRLCARRDLDHHLVILGDDRTWKAGLVKECAELGIGGRVLFASHVPREDLPSVYGAAQVFVLPSLIEGFGLPVLEAMACGTPVVSSRAASLPEVGGDAAEYFDPSSAEALAAALERVLRSRELQQMLRSKGLERVRLFSWEECARRTLDVYRSVLEK
jgi:glycosyltransferase involved in cell wall biosynthesis